MALEMKYFILKPRSKFRDDPWAKASRAAMKVFADEIKKTDPDCSEDLGYWIRREAARDAALDSQ